LSDMSSSFVGQDVAHCGHCLPRQMARAPLTAHAAELYATGAPVVLAGDYNVVPTDLDIYPTKSWDRDAPLQPQSRAANQHLLSQGWTDAIRARHPKEPMYTFWDYKRNRWERDGGLRLDHTLLSSVLTKRLQDAGVDRQTRGMEGASDHAPVWVKLRNVPNRRTTPARHGGGHEPIAEGKLTDRSGDKAGRETRLGSSTKPGISGGPLLVIDGDSFAHRSYHGLPKTIRRGDGKGAGAILGFANFLLRFYTDERPRAVIVGWDSLEMPTKRHEVFPAYQSGRDFEGELIEQLNLLPELVVACGFANAKAPRFEADDFLAAAVASEEGAGGSALVASGDRDSFQLASPDTTILYPMRGGEIARIGSEEVRRRYGVDPKQVPDFIALRGDPSDKLPGATGVGPKRAAELVRRYGSLNGVLDAGLFQTQAQMLRLYRLIATMDASAPLPSLADQSPTWASASNLVRRWGLNQLADRLAEKA
jgi:DNA polymerase I